MSNLANPRECAEWIADWRNHYRSDPEAFRARMARTAAEQARNLAAIRSDGGHSSIRIDDYAQSVAMLERAANG
jgi:hypothetical protein